MPLKLSSFYFFYFGSIGVFMPYWGKYLKLQGYSSGQIGALIGLVSATKIIAPYVWGMISDKTGKRVFLIKVGALLAPLVFLLSYLDVGFVGLVMVMFAYSFFWNAILPLYEAKTMSFVGSDHALYSKIRLWGSVGFVVASVSVGWVIQYLIGIAAVPFAFLFFLLGIALSAVLLKADAPKSPTQPEFASISIIQVLNWPLVIFFTACCLMQMSHGAYYSFFTIYLNDYGFSDGVIGLLWGWAVLAEVIAFAKMRTLFKYFSVRGLLFGSLFLTAVRWWILAFFGQYAVWVVVAQAIHAASFGAFHAACIVVIHELFPNGMQGRAQALYTSISFGVGGAGGAYLSGHYWDSLGGQFVFIVSGLCALLGAVLIYFALNSIPKLLTPRT